MKDQGILEISLSDRRQSRRHGALPADGGETAPLHKLCLHGVRTRGLLKKLRARIRDDFP